MSDAVDQSIDWLAENDTEELRDLAHSLAAEVRLLRRLLRSRLDELGEARAALGRVEAVCGQWESRDTTLPNFPGESLTDQHYREGFYAAVEIARKELRTALAPTPGAEQEDGS